MGSCGKTGEAVTITGDRLIKKRRIWEEEIPRGSGCGHSRARLSLPPHWGAEHGNFPSPLIVHTLNSRTLPSALPRGEGEAREGLGELLQPRAEVWGSPQQLQLGTMQALSIKVHLLPAKATKSLPRDGWIQKDEHRKGTGGSERARTLTGSSSCESWGAVAASLPFPRGF